MNHKHLITICAASFILAGCQTIPLQLQKQPEKVEDITDKPKENVLDVIQAPGATQAEYTQSSDIKKDALISIVKEAVSSESPKREALLLKATHTALKQEKPKLASKIFSKIQPEMLANQNDLDYFYALIGLELAVGLQDLDKVPLKYEALEKISNARRIPLTTRHYLEDTEIRASALSLLNDHLAAARLMVFRIGNIKMSDDQLQIWHDHIWSEISLYRSNRILPKEQENLAIETAQAPSDDWQAWLELSDLFDNIDKSQLSQIQGQLQNWKNTWQSTKLSNIPPTQVKEFMIADFKQVNRVAVLLPSSGELRHAGKAIIDGIMAAYYQEQDISPNQLKIVFYDTNSGTPVTALYDQAIAEGAEFVVGPLQKELVEQLQSYIQSKPIEERVPTLALNYTQEDTPHDRYFFEFGLRAEDEAIAVAEYAVQKGYSRALVLRPDSAWGERVSASFTQEFEKLDGKVLDEAAFTQPRQFSNEVQALLGLNQSKARAAAIERKLGQDIEYLPRRRQDVDFIFLLASPNEARQLKPTINYHYGQDIPVLATSHLYSGTSHPQYDKDLDHIQFVDIPWILHPDSQLQQVFDQHIPGAQSQFKRLHALGIDSFKLMREYPILKHVSSSQVEGTTGELQVTATGQIYRELSWAEFDKGNVVPIETHKPQTVHE